MSRTFRRKNYEQENNSSWDRKGRKLAGAYTVKDLVKFVCVRSNHLHYTHDYVYREPTEAEYSKEYWKIHGDNRNYFRSPDKWYRFFTIHQYRMQDKRELRKFMKNEDYEPMCRDRISSGYWD